MKVEDMIENYLLSMGQKINLESYNFITKRNYDYKSKVKEETLKIGKYKVELTKINRNTKELSNILYNAKSNFNNSVTISEDVSVSCKNIVNNAITYFSDFLKYAHNNFDLTKDVAEKFITLCNGAINTLGRDIENTLSEYNIKMAEAQRQGAIDAQNSLQSSLADIESKKSTYITLDSYHDSIYGDRVTGYVSQGYSDKAFHEGMLAGARQAADIIGALPVKAASKEAVEGLKNLRNKTVAEFNNNFEDLVAAKIKNLIDTDLIDKSGNNLNDNPTIYKHYYSIINELKEEDLENFSRAIEFYNFDIKDQITSEALENIIKYYNENNSFAYEGGDVLLAIHLNKDQYVYRKDIINRIKESIKNKLQKVKKADIISTLEKSLEPIESCKYIKEEDIKQIKKECKEIADKEIEKRKYEAKEKKTLILLNILSSVSIIILVIISILVATKFLYKIGSSGILSLIVAPVLAIGFIALFIKNFSIKNKIIKICIIVISLVISTYGVITINKVNEFRKNKALVTYYYGDTEFKWLEKGTLIDLTFPEKYIDDERAQGWINEEGKFYVEGIIVTENIKLNFSEAQGTPSNGMATIVFKLENGQPDFTYKEYIGSWLKVPQNPVKEGYTFTGWVTGKKKTPVIHKETTVEGNLVVTATYTKNKTK